MQSADDASTERVGPAIAAARQQRGLTVEQVSEATRIRATLIRQIERDDFSGCGGSVYARGHIRSIARVLEADPAPLVSIYDRDHDRVPAPLVAPAPEFDPLHARDQRARRGFGWTSAMIGSLVVICLIALVMLVLPDSGGDDTARPVSPPASAPASAPAAPVPAPTTPAAAATSMNVRVQARGDKSWLEVRDDREQVLVQQLLQQGEERTVVSERAIEIKMGNAGAVGLSCNGRDLGVPGSLGEVVTVRLTLAASGDCTAGGEGPNEGFAAAPAPLASTPGLPG